MNPIEVLGEYVLVRIPGKTPCCMFACWDPASEPARLRRGFRRILLFWQKNFDQPGQSFFGVATYPPKPERVVTEPQTSHGGRYRLLGDTVTKLCVQTGFRSESNIPALSKKEKVRVDYLIIINMHHAKKAQKAVESMLGISVRMCTIFTPNMIFWGARFFYQTQYGTCPQSKEMQLDDFCDARERWGLQYLFQLNHVRRHKGLIPCTC